MAALNISTTHAAADLRTMWLGTHPHYGTHFDTTELGQRNSRGDFESFVHINGLDQDEADQMLLGFCEGSFGS